MYNVKEAAKVMHLTVDDVLALLKSGKLKGKTQRDDDTLWRTTARQIEAYFDS